VINLFRKRGTLENKEHYGLKRWEIGEIASKIGQLYYHYYLRTSETNYLYESYVFYEATRERQYFREVIESKNQVLVIKKLRYYARFIVVCLLLNRGEMIKILMSELTTLVDDYKRTFNPSDSNEWAIVISEISTFLEAEKKLGLTSVEGDVLVCPSRLLKDHKEADKPAQQKLRLQEAILVGNFQNQIKFSELTLDMYRMLQSLEREPSAVEKKDELATITEEEASKVPGLAVGEKQKRSNPHKYLLYRPTFAQLMVYIAIAFKDITDNSALLLYISADGSKRNVKDGQLDSLG
ncbi:hypothetical protein HK096_000681, partial [Nowakowskiella sp. JEL0078]